MTQEDIRKDSKIDFIGRKKSPNKKIINSKMNRSQFDSLRTKNLSNSQINTIQFNSTLQSPKISFNANNSSLLNSPNASLNFSQPKFRAPNHPHPTPHQETNFYPKPNPDLPTNPIPVPNRNLKNLLSEKIQNQYHYNPQPQPSPEPKKDLTNNKFLQNIKKIYSKELHQENSRPGVKCSAEKKCQPNPQTRLSRPITRNFLGQARPQDPKKAINIDNFNLMVFDQRNQFANKNQNFDRTSFLPSPPPAENILDLGVEIFDQDGDFDSTGSCSNVEFFMTEMSEIQRGKLKVKGRTRSENSRFRVGKGGALSLRVDELERGEFFG